MCINIFFVPSAFLYYVLQEFKKILRFLNEAADTWH